MATLSCGSNLDANIHMLPPTMQLDGRRILLLGAGESQYAAYQYLVKQGAQLTVMDTREKPPHADRWREIAHCFGSLKQAWMLTADLIVLSPGLSLFRPELELPKARGIPIMGDIALFSQLTDAPIIGITGSNGKSTVTGLLASICKAAGLRYGIGGNYGTPVFRLLEENYPLYLLELSSFQLDTAERLPLKAAALLNLSPDHLDRYPTGWTGYQASKHRIHQAADYYLYNYDDHATYPPQSYKGKAEAFGYGTDPAYGLISTANERWLSIKGTSILPARSLPIHGNHNALNALAACGLATQLNLSIEAMRKGLIAYRGLPHRFEHVDSPTSEQIVWINDSKATNVGSTCAALEQFPDNQRIHLLLGGIGKNADFSVLQPWLLKKAIQIYPFGSDRAVIAQLTSPPSVSYYDLESAVRAACKAAKPGDVILLSPACASLDQFANFEERGACFRRLAAAGIRAWK